MILLVRGYGQTASPTSPDGSPGSVMQNTVPNQLTYMQPPLSGTYTIGGSDGNYATFTEAIKALKAAESSQEPVIFKVRPGTYTEQLDLEGVNGIVNFEGETGDSTDVILQYYGSGPVVKGMGTGSLRHMTISGTGDKVISMREGASRITIENNIIKGGASATLIFYEYAYGNYGTYEQVYRNNLLLGGLVGIEKGRYRFFDFESGALELDNGPVIAGNIFQGQKSYGIRLFAQQNAVIEKNTIAIEGAGTAIELSNCFFENKVNSNDIISANGRGTGLSFRGEGYATEVIGNKITLLEGGIGIFFGIGDYRYTKALVVANNLVSIFSKDKSTGIALEGPYYKANFYFNTIHLYGNDPESQSIYLNVISITDLLNNIFSNQAGGKAIDIGKTEWTSAPGEIGYNVYYSDHVPNITGTNNLLFDPEFVSNRNLRPRNSVLNGAGRAVAGIELDFFGLQRSTPPDIGAVEFDPGKEEPSAPLAGIYTIGGGYGDYASFQAAVSALATKGVSGPVTFKVRAGAYEEQLVISRIPGSGCQVPVVFEGAEKDSTQVILKAEGDFVLKVEDVDGLAFKRLTISSTTYGAKLLYLEQADCFSLSNSRLIGQQGKSQQLIWSLAAGQHTNITNNFFANGNGYCIYMHSGEGERGSLEFRGNRAEDIAGISIYRLDNLVFQNNRLSLSNEHIAFVEGIEMNSANYSQPLSGNRIVMNNQNPNMGLEISGLNNDFLSNEVLFKGLQNGVILSLANNDRKEITIANNIISKENDNQHALWVRSSSETDYRLNIYFNTFYLGGGSAGFNASLRIGGTDTGQTDDPFALLDIRNNIFMDTGEGRALSIHDAETALNSDYNAFFSPNQSPLQIGEQAYSLENWQQTFEQDLHSLLQDPLFVSADSLVPTNPALSGAGIAIEGLGKDIYGKPRSFPRDIGAVEFDAGTQRPLAGTYTIGGSDGDFPTFTLAGQALQARGIAEAVTFKVRPGVYEESFLLGEVLGSSCERRIVFEGDSADSTAVTLKALRGALFIEGTDGLSFRYLTIDGVKIREGSNCLTFENNRLEYIDATSGPGALASNEHIYRNNYFSRGIAKEKSGPFEPASPDFDEGLEISGNTMNSGISLGAQKGIIINDNRITLRAAGGGRGAIELTNCWYGKEIRRNRIMVDSYYGDVFGIKTTNGIPERVSENSIGMGAEETIPSPFPGEVGLGGGTGLLVSTGKTASGQVLIANNSIGVDGWDRSGRINTMRGIHIQTTNFNDDIIKIYHNAASTSGYKDLQESSALYTEVAAENSLHILNNSFTDYADGYKVHILHPIAVAVSDYNYFSDLGVSIFKWGDQEISDLAAWQALSGMDEHSITNWPLEGAGIKVEEVDIDINGKIRKNPPSIGPLEWGEPEQPKPMVGTYTIGGSDGNFADLTQATQALENQGIAGPVTFKIRPGIYEEQLSINPFPGNSAQNPLVFEGVEGDSTQVVLQYPGDYVLQINGADGLTFRYLTFKRTGSEDAPPLSTKVIDIKGGADYITIEHNLLQGKQNDIVIYSYGESPTFTNDHHVYRNNSLLGGGIGFRKEVNSIYPESIIEQDVVVEGNKLQQLSHQGILLEYQNNVNVSNNAIQVFAPGKGDTNGIKIRHCQNRVKVNSNKIWLKGSWSRGLSVFEDVDEIRDNYIYLKGNGMGIDLGSYETHSRVDIINNIITIEAKETEESIIYEGGIGIYTFYATDTLQLYNNSILIHGKSDNNAAIFIDQDFPDNWIFKNNIFANTAGGYALIKISDLSTFLSDYNAYFTTGDRFIKYDRIELPDLASWKALNGTDEHSIFANPQFASDSLLIPSNPALNGAGLPLQAVPNDFFGQPRSSPPDIGAVEFEPAAPVAPVQPIVECISRNKDGSYTATFGYNNPNPQAQTVARGPANRLSLFENAGQPVIFEPGRHESVFHVVFERRENLSWTLGSETTTVDVNATFCEEAIQAVVPMVACVSGLSRSIYMAKMGYHNPNGEPVAIATGRLNRMFGQQDQGQPKVFLPGYHPEEFYATFSGSLMWSLGNERVIANSRTQSCKPALQAVQPILECVSSNDEGGYIAYFGYYNPNTVAVSTGFMLHNLLLPFPMGRGEVPTIFEAGRHEYVFSISFRSWLEWRLMGTTVRATSSTVLDCEKVAADAIYPESLKSELLAYPLPFDQVLQVKVKNNTSEKIFIRLWTLHGLLLLEETRPNSHEPIVLELGHLDAATYLLEVQTSSSLKRIRVMKQ